MKSQKMLKNILITISLKAWLLKKIIILDDCDKIKREAKINDELLSLIKNLQFSTKFAMIKKEFEKDTTNPLEQLKPNDNS